jgi:hypothetical protein
MEMYSPLYWSKAEGYLSKHLGDLMSSKEKSVSKGKKSEDHFPGEGSSMNRSTEE